MSNQLKLSDSAAENVRETGIKPNTDVCRVLAGLTAEALLAECFDGADEDRMQGWREYVDAVEAEAARRGTVGHDGAARTEDGALVICTQQAYCDGDLYRAAAVDAAGNVYDCRWSIINPDASDETDACNWAAPREVRLTERA